MNKEQLEQAAESYAGSMVWINRKEEHPAEHQQEFYEYISTRSFIAGAEWQAAHPIPADNSQNIKALFFEVFCLRKPNGVDITQKVWDWVEIHALAPEYALIASLQKEVERLRSGLSASERFRKEDAANQIDEQNLLRKEVDELKAQLNQQAYNQQFAQGIIKRMNVKAAAMKETLTLISECQSEEGEIAKDFLESIK